MVHTVITRLNPGLIMNLLNKQTKYRKYLIATAILLIVVVGIAVKQLNSPTSFGHTSNNPHITEDPPGNVIAGWVVWLSLNGYGHSHFDGDGTIYDTSIFSGCETRWFAHIQPETSWPENYSEVAIDITSSALSVPDLQNITTLNSNGRWEGALLIPEFSSYDWQQHHTHWMLLKVTADCTWDMDGHPDDTPPLSATKAMEVIQTIVETNEELNSYADPYEQAKFYCSWFATGNCSFTPTPQPTATPAPPSSSGASLTGVTSMSGSGNTAVQVSISSGSTSVTSDTTTPTPAPLYLRSAGATPFPSIPKYGTPIPTPSISTSQPYIMLKNPKGRYITTSEPVGTEINIVGGNFPGKSEIESMWLTPVDPPHGEPIDITPQTKYFDVWSLSYKYQKNQTDKSGVVNETITIPDAPPGLYYIELTARKVLGTTAKTQSTLFRIPGDPDLTTPVPYAIPAPYPTSTPYPVPVQVRAQRNISFDTQTRNSMKYDIDFGPNKICSDDL